MTMTRQLFGFLRSLALLSMLGSLVLTPGLAQAGSKGRLNTTLLLGAGTLYEALHKKKTNALILGAGTVYAYTRYNADRKAEKNRRRAVTSYRSYSTTSSYRPRYGAASTRRTRTVTHTVKRHYRTVNGKRVWHN